MNRKRTAAVTITAIITIVVLAVLFYAIHVRDEAVRRLFLKSKMIAVEERGLKFRREVGYRVVTAKWVMETWGEIPQSEIEKYRILGEVYRLLGIIPWETDLVSIVEGQRGAAMAAAVGDDVYIVREYFHPESEAYTVEILVHELTHILQRQNLPSYSPEWYDETLAWYSLIEGDALITAYSAAVRHYNYRPFRVSLGYPENYSDPLRMLWLFPYAYGDDFIQNLYRLGGWNLVNRCYSNPPVTTEQILYPERYLAGESYVGVDTPLIPGFTVKYTDRMGMFFLNVYVGVNAGTEYVNVSSAWQGDNLTLQERNGSSLQSGP